MNISFKNKNNSAYERLFDDLVKEVFGFSFASWFDQKLWNDNYESYSIIENGKMLSNLCIFKSELIICGEKISAIQFGAVATRKNERGKGFSRVLMEHVLQLYPNIPGFLFANPSVLDFYPKFGFRQIQTYKPEISVKINNASTTAVKLHINDDIVTEALNSRKIFSNLIDCVNSQSIQTFHMIMSYSNDIYYLPNCKTVVIAIKKDSRLFVADVIAKKQVTFADLAKELLFNGINTVEFGFCPEWLAISPVWKPANMADEPFFVRGEWNLPNEFIFPVTSCT